LGDGATGKDINIYERLPFFLEETLYPEFDKSLRIYKQEAQVLREYMKDSYGISYPGFNLLTGLLEIPLDERWLKGEEYAFLLRHYKTYNKLLGFTVNDKSQDTTVYETPRSKFKYNEINIDGMVYFMKGMHLREFGFPRLKDDINQQRTEKPYKWKKTNFVTDLPKH
jgi:hypothetical protein